MYNVKLAPLKGLSKEEVRSERLESLTELMLTDPVMPPGTHSITNFGHNRNHSPENLESIIDSSGDSNYHTRAASPGEAEAVITKEEEFFQSSRRALHNNHSSKPLSNNTNKVQKPSPLGVNDVNNLWTVYLNQQQKLGVDISDKQSMAKSYHNLDTDQVGILRELHQQEQQLPIIKPRPTRKSKHMTNPSSRKETPRTPLSVPKSVNKRQQRKKNIRDELKRQLNTFTTLSETEGFPWKAIVSKSGFRDLKLVGWPRAIPRLKRIDDFNPNELNLFEEGIASGSIKIIKNKKKPNTN